MSKKLFPFTVFFIAQSSLYFLCTTGMTASEFKTTWNDVYQTTSGHDKHTKIHALALQDDAYAQYILSIHFRLGEFVETDLKKANDWLIKSANNGYAEAEYILATCYSSKKYHFPLDDTKAVYWLKRSAAKGYISAQYELGEHYHRGVGIKKDKILSYVWLTLASREDSFVSIRARHMVKDEMTNSEIKKAEALTEVYFSQFVTPFNQKP